LSEGDVQLLKLFRQTVPERWPGGGKTAKQRSPNWLHDLLTKHVRLLADRRGWWPAAVTSVHSSAGYTAVHRSTQPPTPVGQNCKLNVRCQLLGWLLLTGDDVRFISTWPYCCALYTVCTAAGSDGPTRHSAAVSSGNQPEWDGTVHFRRFTDSASAAGL